MSDTILNRIKDALSFLVEELGFRIVDESYNPEAFGNAVVTLESGDFAVRVMQRKLSINEKRTDGV